MRNWLPKIMICCTACWLSGGPALQAQEIYRWVDENGVVTFSDTAPAAAGAPVNTIEIEDTVSSTYDPEEDIYNIAATAERMQALRDERAEEREARRERERSAVSQPVVQQPQPLGYAWPAWWNRPGSPGYRPPSRPQRPIEPPTPQPGPPATLKPPPFDSSQ